MRNLSRLLYNSRSYTAAKDSFHKPKVDTVSRKGWKENKFVKGIQTLGYAIGIGAGMTVIYYSVNSAYRELSNQTLAWSIFDEASILIKDSEMIQRSLGIPIMSFGNDSTDNRIKNTLNYIVLDDDTIVQMSFMIQGPKGKGHVHVEKRKEKDKWEFQRLYVSDQYGQVITILYEPPRQYNKSGIFKFNKLYKWI